MPGVGGVLRGAARLGGAPDTPPPVRWSVAPVDLVPNLVARQAFSVVVAGPRRLRAARRLKLLFVPLDEVREGILLGTPRTDWFVWTDVGRVGTVARLPTDPARLADSLELPRSGDGAVLREALRQLAEELYGERLA